MQNQQLEPVLILYLNYKAVKYISLTTIMEKVRIGCRKNFVNADILVDEQFPGEGILFELRRDQEAQSYFIILVKGQWKTTDASQCIKQEEKLNINHGDQIFLKNAPLIIYYGDSSDILSDSVSDDSADLEGNAYEKYLLNYQNFSASAKPSEQKISIQIQEQLRDCHTKCGVMRSTRLTDHFPRKFKKIE